MFRTPFFNHFCTVDKNTFRTFFTIVYHGYTIRIKTSNLNDTLNSHAKGVVWLFLHSKNSLSAVKLKALCIRCMFSAFLKSNVINKQYFVV